MRGNVFVQVPGKQLTSSIGGIGGEPFGPDAERFLGSLNHSSGRGHLVIGARWRCLDVDNDGVVNVDHTIM
jgi:hypothetical protein